MSDVTKETVYTQVMESTRHYSNLRFAMMPVYITITGALAVATFSDEIITGASPLKTWFWYAGLAATICFAIFELALTFNLHYLWTTARELAGSIVGSAFKSRSGFLTWPVRIASAGMYVGGLAFWLSNQVP